MTESRGSVYYQIETTNWKARYTIYAITFVAGFSYIAWHSVFRGRPEQRVVYEAFGLMGVMIFGLPFLYKPVAALGDLIQKQEHRRLLDLAMAGLAAGVAVVAIFPTGMGIMGSVHTTVLESIAALAIYKFALDGFESWLEGKQKKSEPPSDSQRIGADEK